MRSPAAFEGGDFLASPKSRTTPLLVNEGRRAVRFECGSSCSSTRLAGTPRHTTRCQDVPLVGDSALDSDVTQVAVLIIRPEQHHPVEIVPLVIPVEKRAYLQPRDAPQSRILGPRRGIPD